MKLLLLMVTIALAAALPAPLSSTNRWDPNCGRSLISDAGAERPGRIIGGWDAIKGEWPWQVSMGASADIGNHYCGAVVMNANWIISAAHCCAGETPSGVFLKVGEQDFGDDTNPDRAAYGVTEIYMHENYDDFSLENDICLLRIDGNITFSDYVQPACAPEAGNLYVGAPAHLSGWGSTGSGPSPDIMQTTNLPVITNADCETSMLAEEPTWFITDDMICAGTIPNDDRDTCQGDSGGPLTTKNADNTFSLLGLTSWGFGCADGVPGVYSRVPYFLDWIDAIITA